MSAPYNSPPMAGICPAPIIFWSSAIWRFMASGSAKASMPGSFDNASN